jgi:phage nucleotide-binding protein
MELKLDTTFDKEISSVWGIKKLDLLPQKGRTVMIYGQAGRGKTSLINTLKGNILLINIDCGEQVINSKNPNNTIHVMNLISDDTPTATAAIKKFEAFADWLLKKDELPWDYIVIDNISLIENSMLFAIVERRKDKIKSPDQNAYGEAGFAILDSLTALRNLTFKGVHLIYIAWEKTEKISDFGGEVHSEKGPMLVGQTQLKVSGLVDFVMAMRVDKKGERYLQLDADHKYSCKKRDEAGIVFPAVIECPKNSDDTLQRFFDLMKRD